jgi:hypothetical protein
MELPITTDIRNTKSKDIGNFSFQQAAFLAGGLGTGFLTWKASGSYELAFVPTAIILIFGFFKPFGMSMFTFLRIFINERILSAKNLVYEDNFEFTKEVAEMFQKDGYDIGEVEYANQAAPQKYKWSKEDKRRLCK